MRSSRAIRLAERIGTRKRKPSFFATVAARLQPCSTFPTPIASARGGELKMSGLSKSAPSALRSHCPTRAINFSEGKV